MTHNDIPPPEFGWKGAPRLAAIAAGYNDGGGPILWALQNNYKIGAIAQTVDGRWSEWHYTDWSGPGQPEHMIQMAATAIESPFLQFWTIDYKGELWSAAQAAKQPWFGPWERSWNNAPRALKRIAAVHRRGVSTAAVWAIQSDYSLISCYKRAPNDPNRPNTWSDWTPWAQTPEKSQFIQLAAALQINGCAQLWAIDTKLQLWSCFETTPGGTWSDWSGPNWNHAPKLFRVAACQQTGGVGASVWGVTQDYSLINTYFSNGNWTNWSPNNWQGCLPVIDVAAALQSQGRARLWVTLAYSSMLHSTEQKSPGGPWGIWDPPMPPIWDPPMPPPRRTELPEKNRASDDRA